MMPRFFLGRYIALDFSLEQQGKNNGFTLTELMVGVAIAGVVIASLGFALVTLMGIDQTSQSDGDRRVEIDRTLSYLSNDIRQARSVNLPTGYTVNPTACATNTPVLHLRNPDNTNTVYYIRDISGCNNIVWLKPNMIYRVQRTTGGLDLPDPPHAIPNNVGNEIMDAVQPPTTAFTCPSGEQAGANGFYVCLENSRSLTIHLFGRGSQGQTMPVQSTRVAVRGS